MKHRNEKIRKPEDSKPKRKRVKLDVNESIDENTVLVDDDDDEEEDDEDGYEDEEVESENNHTSRLSKKKRKICSVKFSHCFNYSQAGWPQTQMSRSHHQGSKSNTQLFD